MITHLGNNNGQWDVIKLCIKIKTIHIHNDTYIYKRYIYIKYIANYLAMIRYG